MSTEANKALIHRYLDALSGKDKPAATVDMYVTDEELKHHIAINEAAFPHYLLISDDMIAEGDKVMVRLTFQGTHMGDLMGIPASGKQVTVPGMIVYRIADDKIVEHWMQIDMLGLLQQIGAMPSMA